MNQDKGLHNVAMSPVAVSQRETGAKRLRKAGGQQELLRYGTGGRGHALTTADTPAWQTLAVLHMELLAI